MKITRQYLKNLIKEELQRSAKQEQLLREMKEMAQVDEGFMDKVKGALGMGQKKPMISPNTQKVIDHFKQFANDKKFMDFVIAAPPSFINGLADIINGDSNLSIGEIDTLFGDKTRFMDIANSARRENISRDDVPDFIKKSFKDNSKPLPKPTFGSPTDAEEKALKKFKSTKVRPDSEYYAKPDTGPGFQDFTRY